MRRTQTVLIIVALLATPLALVARGMACESPACPCACERLHGHAPSQQTQSVTLRRIATGYCPYCGKKLGHHTTDFGFLAPIAPTAPIPAAALPRPHIARAAAATFEQASVAGFSIEPFQPPRA